MARVQNAHGRTKIRQNNFQMTKIEINIGFNYSEKDMHREF